MLCEKVSRVNACLQNLVSVSWVAFHTPALLFWWCWSPIEWVLYHLKVPLAWLKYMCLDMSLETVHELVEHYELCGWVDTAMETNPHNIWHDQRNKSVIFNFDFSKQGGSGTTSLAWTYIKVCGYSDCFCKTWTKGHWPLDDLWPHICWGLMCDSTQGSLCPSPMKIHQSMWIQWPFLQKFEPKVTDP